MSFKFPLGLLGLLGIPIIILIYIIKNKHTEQIITSTYLWELSNKFLAKKKPISILSGVVSLALQIIAIATISLVIAHPIITLPNSAKEYCFILDASGSMSMLQGEISRMELGKNEIKDIINSSANGSKYTLVYAGANTRVIYEKLGNKEKACELLGKLESTGVSVSYNSALKYVQEYFDNYSSVVTYLVTDKDYTSSNIEIINVSNNEENYAVVNTEYLIDGSKLSIYGNVISYESDAILEVELYIDDNFQSKQDISVSKLVEGQYKFDIVNVDFESIKVVISNLDGLTVDNTNVIYNIEKAHDYRTLIISDRPFYLKSVIETVGNTSVDVISTENYDPSISGYSLYVFDSFNPSGLPTDGTIWLFGVSTSISEAGFSVQDVVEYEEGIELTYPKNSTTTFKMLTKGLEKEAIYVSKYIKYGVYRNFTTLLTCEGNPVVFSGSAENGCREVVFAFDLHDSNLPLLMDYLILSKNLLEYSFPIILDQSSSVAGEKIVLNVLSNCDSIRVETPSGDVFYLDVSSETAEFTTSEAGTYLITVVSGNDVKEFKIYSSLPKTERFTSEEIAEISLHGELGNDFTDGIYDKLIVFFIILAVVFVADWMVYCYEQYQLR